MTSIAIATDTYTLITSTWLSIQNVGHNDIWLFIGGIPADDTVQGFVLKPLDMAYPDTFGSGDVYVRTKITGKTCNIAIAV